MRTSRTRLLFRSMVLTQYRTSPFQIIAMLYWWFWGYKTFTGPRPNLRGNKHMHHTKEVQEYNEDTGADWDERGK